MQFQFWTVNFFLRLYVWIINVYDRQKWKIKLTALPSLFYIVLTGKTVSSSIQENILQKHD